jgi:hypothetical protein
MMTQSTTNPFKTLLSGLSQNKTYPVTLQFLEWVTGVINEPSVVVQTYGEAFQVLEFLDAARVVKLTKIPESEIYTIEKL